MEVGSLLKKARRRQAISLRDLSAKAGISPSSLSMIEREQSSPTLATLHKLLRALGTDFAAFFADAHALDREPVFRAADMRLIEDAHRKYSLLFPARHNLKFQIVRETISHTEPEAEWEVHDVDMGGVLLSGGPLRLEIADSGQYEIRAGDAFYVEAGTRHRACNVGRRPAKLITVAYPARY